MGIVSDILGLLGRPITAPDPEPAPARGRARPPAPEALPVTEEELRAALTRLYDERVAAGEVIAGAGAERERLLMDEGSDEALALLGRQVDAANLTLERLERVEPELHNRLAALQDAQRIALWAELQAEYVHVGRLHVEALRAIKLDWAAYDAAFQAIAREFPRAVELLPRFPFVHSADTDSFEEALRKFSWVRHDPRPARPMPEQLSRQKEHPDYDPQRAAATWGATAAATAATFVWVKMLHPCDVGDGRFLKRGELLRLDAIAAHELVTKGRAEMTEPPEGED